MCTELIHLARTKGMGFLKRKAAMTSPFLTVNHVVTRSVQRRLDT